MQHGLPEQAIEPTASRTGANKLGYRAVKRVFDLTATAMAVIVLSPLFLILSVIVYLGDPGAVIYGQVRIGKNGKPFKMWKFRSMYRNADQMIDQLSEEQKRQYHTEFKIDNDPRITPVGNFLRKTRLSHKSSSLSLNISYKVRFDIFNLRERLSIVTGLIPVVKNSNVATFRIRCLRALSSILHAFYTLTTGKYIKTI